MAEINRTDWMRYAPPRTMDWHPPGSPEAIEKTRRWSERFDENLRQAGIDPSVRQQGWTTSPSGRFPGLTNPVREPIGPRDNAYLPGRNYTPGGYRDPDVIHGRKPQTVFDEPPWMKPGYQPGSGRDRDSWGPTPFPGLRGPVLDGTGGRISNPVREPLGPRPRFKTLRELTSG